eukprot:TRINITY_DN4240_c0_g1_i5.p3 TRINITY_DN4240_c0_g1~~TRINITY_DN4240_c0_g1_i5.p3  ORF type:complete len:169 (+),score=32.92 TRINITY_DN4240_c0_g1_i5:517-1023(+)
MHKLWIAGFAACRCILVRPEIPETWKRVVKAEEARAVTINSKEAPREIELTVVKVKTALNVQRATSNDTKKPKPIRKVSLKRNKRKEIINTHSSDNKEEEIPETSNTRAETPITSIKKVRRTAKAKAPSIVPIIISGQERRPFKVSKRPTTSLMFETTLPCAVSMTNF